MRRNAVSAHTFLLLALSLGINWNKSNAASSRASSVLMKIVATPEGCERKSRVGDILSLSYIAKSDDGTIVDYNDEKLGAGHLYEIQLGLDQIIDWDDHLTDMCIDEIRQLTVLPRPQADTSDVPSHIPKGVPLHYEVKLHGIRDGPPPKNIFKQIDSDKNGKITRVELKAHMDREISKRREEVEEYRALTEKLEKELKKSISRLNERLDAIFTSDDKNGDGVISHEEFVGPKHDEF